MAVVRPSGWQLQAARIFRTQLVMLSMLAAFLMVASSAAHSQVSCTGLCLQQVACTGGKTTSISGTVYAPNGTDPLPNVLVYIPNAPVTALASGISCTPNGTPASGSPLVSTTTAVDGTFTLTNVPVGSNIPLVVQAGKWRRQFVIPATSSCGNTLASTATGSGGVIRLPKNKSEGDIPLIAIATGQLDAVECVLKKMGVDGAEFTNPGGGGRINLYAGKRSAGSTINGSTPSETVLEDNLSTLNQYDLVMLPCQGNPYTPDSTALANMVSYANGGGRIYATHYSYDFLYQNGAFNTVASWSPGQAFPADQTATINQSFPDGDNFAQWLKVVNPSSTLGKIPVNTIRKDQNGINPATSQEYLSITNPSEVIQFTFSTPVGAAPANQCGRVLYNEYHVENVDDAGTTFPAECGAGAITPQEQFLEYSLFDLGTFNSPPAVPTVAVSFVNPATPLVQGDSADSVTVNITNTGTTATNTTLTFALTLPAGLTSTALAPQNNTSGWTCNFHTLTCTRSGTGLDAGASDNVVVTFSVSPTATSPETLNAAVSNGNLASPATASAQLTVLLVPTITWPMPAPITYGTPLSGTQLDATATYNGATVLGSFVYSPAAPTVLSTGLQQLNTAFTPTDPTTYASANQIVGLTVNPAPLTVTAGSYSGTYDGNIHALPACTVSENFDGLTCTNSPVGPVGPDVGGTVVTPVVIGSVANYSVVTNNGAWSITALPVTVTAGSYSGMYDGTAHATSGCTSSYAGVTCTNSPASVGPGVSSGLVTPVPSYATGIPSDYGVTPNPGTYSITKASSVTSLSCPASVAYNGTAQTPCTASVTGAGGLSQSVDVAYGMNTNVGTATATATFAGDANHTTSTKSTTFTITPVPLTVTAGSYTGAYDGSSHALSGCVVSSNPDGLTCTNSPVGPVGPDVGGASVTPLVSGPTANYNVTLVNGSWSITPRSVTLTAGSYSGAYDGSAHSPSACTSSYSGLTCANSPASVGPGAGSGTVSAVASYGTSSSADYAVNYVAGAYSITKLAASVTPNAATKVYGTADPVLTGALSGFLPADGVTATYTRSAGETVAGSPYTISATLSPSAVLSNYTVTSNTAGFTITKANPVVSWSNPAAIVYGTPLSATQLNATANPSGGTFGYTPSAGTVLGVGSQPLSVLYTPSDTADYNTATASVMLTVNQATPVVTWANPPSIVYGTGTGAAQKTATATGLGGVSLPGSYFYTTPDGTIFPVGNHTLGVGFTPTDSTDYVPVSAYATLTVTKATPTVTWAAPAAITYGTALSGAQLNAMSPVPGTFVYTPAAGAVLHAGSQTLSVTFTPNDATDYNPVTTTVPLTVNKATPVITWPTPASITYGTPLSATQLDATANVAGTFLYTASTGPNPLGVLLPPGTTALSATLTPTDTVDYNPVTAYVVFTVSKAQTTTTLAVSTTQTVTGTTATLTATVRPQIGGVPTGTVTYYNGSTVLGSAAVGTAFTTAVLPVGTDSITAVYGGDANFVGSSSSASAVVSVAPTTVQLTSPLSRVFYPGSAVSFTVIVPLKNFQLISGTVTLYDGNTVIGTYSLPAGGILVGITPQLGVGTHALRAVYGGNGQYPPGQSPVVTVTVSAL